MKKIKQSSIVLMILFSAFVMLLFLSSHNSYWIDELFSVKTYGTDHNNVFTMIDALGRNSIHPPLYQIILFFWIKIFGYTEIITRSLSILYMLGAALLIYLQTAKFYNPRTALFTLILFTFSYMPIYYALEARSYAQTLFLSTLSSYLFIEFILNQKKPYWLIVCNLALLMTHYYNAAFVAAQALFALYYCYKTRSNILKTIIVFAIPVILFSILWGKYMLMRQAQNPTYINISHPNPITIFYYIVYYSVNLPLIVYPLILIALMSIPLILRRKILNRRIHFSNHTYFFAYTYWLIIFIPIGAFCVTFIGKYNSRYIIYYIPPLILLLTITIEKIIGLIRKIRRNYIRHSVTYMIIACSILIIPRGFLAAITAKDDWRGLAQNIISITEQNNDEQYIIFELASKFPLMDHYFTRYSQTVHVFSTINRNAVKEFSIENYDNMIEKNDYLILFAVNEDMLTFNNVIMQTCDVYQYSFSQTFGNNIYIIFEVHGDEPNTCPPFLTQNGD